MKNYVMNGGKVDEGKCARKIIAFVSRISTQRFSRIGFTGTNNGPNIHAGEWT